MQECAAAFERSIKPITIIFGAQSRPAAPEFTSSIETLLLLGLEQSRADSCSLYIYDSQARTLSLRIRAGACEEKIAWARVQLSCKVTRWLETLDGPVLVEQCAATDIRTESFPEVFESSLTSLMMVPAALECKAFCLLNFGYRKQEPPPEAVRLPGLASLARSVASLLMEEASLQDLPTLARRAGALEAELANMKIAERANGVIGDKARGEEVMAGLASHIGGVLSGASLREHLRQRVEGLEENVRNRQLINHAKARLQQTAMLSEGEAYLHMRNSSRKTRRPLVLVAQEVLARTASLRRRKMPEDVFIHAKSICP